MITNAYDRSKVILTKNKNLLNKIAQVLLEKETLASEEFAEFFQTEKPAPKPTLIV